MNKIKEYKIVNVKCVICDYRDQAVWGSFGSEQPCLNCDAANVCLKKVK